MAEKFVDVSFSMYLDEERRCVMFEDRALPLRSWAELAHNAEAVVQAVCSDYLDEGAYKEWFEADEEDMSVWVVVTAPDWVVGTYKVQIKQEIMFHVRKAAQR